MTETTKTVLATVLALGVPILLLLACAIGWDLYRSSCQAAVWTRQGAPMSTWEVFMGAKPIVRQVNGTLMVAE